MKLRSDCDFRPMYGQKTFEDQAEKFLEVLAKKVPSLKMVDVYDLMADASAQKYIASEAIRSVNNVTEAQVLQFINDMLVKITGGQQQVGSLQELADGQVLANILLKCELAPASLCKFVPQSVGKLKAIVQSLNAIKDKQVVDRLLDTAKKIDPSLLMMKAYTVDDKI